MENNKTESKRNQLTRHHRKPRSLGGGHQPENISKIKFKFHEAWHLLFGDATPEEIAEEINKKYLDPEFRFAVKRTGYQHPERRKK
jgi:hypothetical protein